MESDSTGLIDRISFFRALGLVAVALPTLSVQQKQNPTTIQEEPHRQEKGDSNRLGDHLSFFKKYYEKPMSIGQLLKTANRLSANNSDFKEHWVDLVQCYENNEYVTAQAIQNSVTKFQPKKNIARVPRGLGDHKDFFRRFFKEYRSIGEVLKRANALSAGNLEFRKHWEDLVQRQSNDRLAARAIQGSVRGVFSSKIRQAQKEEAAKIMPPAKSKTVRRTQDVTAAKKLALARPETRIQFDPPKSGKAVFSQAEADYFRSVLAPGGEKLPGAFSKNNIHLLTKNDRRFKEILDRHVERRMMCQRHQGSEEETRKAILHIMKNSVDYYLYSLKKKENFSK